MTKLQDIVMQIMTSPRCQIGIERRNARMQWTRSATVYLGQEQWEFYLHHAKTLLLGIKVPNRADYENQRLLEKVEGDQ